MSTQKPVGISSVNFDPDLLLMSLNAKFQSGENARVSEANANNIASKSRSGELAGEAAVYGFPKKSSNLPFGSYVQQPKETDVGPCDGSCVSRVDRMEELMQQAIWERRQMELRNDFLMKTIMDEREAHQLQVKKLEHDIQVLRTQIRAQKANNFDTISTAGNPRRGRAFSFVSQAPSQASLTTPAPTAKERANSIVSSVAPQPSLHTRDRINSVISVAPTEYGISNSQYGSALALSASRPTSDESLASKAQVTISHKKKDTPDTKEEKGNMSLPAPLPRKLSSASSHTHTAEAPVSPRSSIVRMPANTKIGSDIVALPGDMRQNIASLVEQQKYEPPVIHIDLSSAARYSH